MSLKNALHDPDKLDAIIADCVALIEREVGSKKGLSGVAIRTGFKAVRGLKPGFLEGAVRGLLPEFAETIDPIAAESNSSPIEEHLEANSARVAEALLAITDSKAANSQNKVAKRAYTKLRGSAKEHVEAAMPELARLIARHTR